MRHRSWTSLKVTVQSHLDQFGAKTPQPMESHMINSLVALCQLLGIREASAESCVMKLAQAPDGCNITLSPDLRNTLAVTCDQLIAAWQEAKDVSELAWQAAPIDLANRSLSVTDERNDVAKSLNQLTELRAWLES
jgi:hypothetical protein